MIDQHLAVKTWDEVGQSDKFTIVASVINKLQADYRVKLGEGDLEHIYKSLVVIFTTRYKAWKVIDFVTAVDYGKSGQFGDSSFKLSMVTIEKWLHKYSAEVSARDLREMKKKDFELRTGSFEPLKHADSLYGKAVAWRLEHMMGAIGDEKEHYFNLELKVIADAIESNSTDLILY